MKSSRSWLIVALSVAILGLLAVGSWFYVETKQQLRHAAQEDLQTIAQLKVNQLAEWRAEKLRDGAMIAEGPFLADAVDRWFADPQEELSRKILAAFRSIKEKFDYLNVMLVDGAGRMRLSLNSNVGSLHGEAAKALNEAFRKRCPVLTDLHMGPSNLGPHLGVIAPLVGVRGHNREPKGAIILQIDAARFLYPLIQLWPLPSKSAETLLVRRDGDSALFLNDLRHRKNTALKLRIPLTEKEVPAVMAIDGKEGVVEGMDYRNVEVLSVLKPVPHSPWFMIAKIDRAEALAVWPIRSFLVVVSLIAISISFIAMGAVVWQRNAKVNYKALYEKEAMLRRVEERYRTTLLSVGDGVISTNNEGQVELMNPVAEVLTGWSSDEAYGKPLEEVFRIINEETRLPVENPVTKVMREGAVVGLANHTLLIDRDGAERPIADSGAPVRDQDGAISGTVLIFRDQTAERRSRRELEEKEQLLQSTGRMARVGGWELDADSLEVTWTEQTHLIHEVPLDYKPPLDEAINYFNEDDRPKLKKAIENALQHGTPYDMEIRFITAKGNQLWTRTMCEPEVVDGKTIRLRGTFQDITESKTNEEQLRQAHDRLSLALEAGALGLWDWNANTDEVFYDEGWASMLGYSPGEIESSFRSWERLVHPDDKDRVLESLEEHIKGHSTRFQVEQRLKTKSGEWKWILAEGRVVERNQDGSAARILGIHRDISDRVEMENRLKNLQRSIRPNHQFLARSCAGG